MHQPVPCAIWMDRSPRRSDRGADRPHRPTDDEAAEAVVHRHPDAVVVLVPGSGPTFGIAHAGWALGDPDRPEAAHPGRAVPEGREAAQALAQEAVRAGLAVRSFDALALPFDHSAPLRALARAGWAGPTVVVSVPGDADDGERTALGRAIARAAAGLRQRWTLVVGGAPADLEDLAPAGADAWGADAAEVVGAALEGDDADVRPASARPPPRLALPGVSCDDLAVWAREALHAHLHGRTPSRPRERDPADLPSGVYVALLAPGRRVRGCVGRLSPFDDPIHDVVAECAVAGAGGTDRSPPVTASEVDALTIEVGVLGPLEPVDDLADVDPRRHGIVVVQGDRRAILFPGTPEFATPQQQVIAACLERGLDIDAPLEVYRFLEARGSDPGAARAGRGGRA